MLYARTIGDGVEWPIVGAFREALRLLTEASPRMRELEQALDLVVLMSNPEPFRVTAGRFLRLAMEDGPHALRGFDPEVVPYGILVNADSIAWAGPTVCFSFFYDPVQERAVVNVEHREDGEPVPWTPTTEGWELVDPGDYDDFPVVAREPGVPPTRPLHELLVLCAAAGIDVPFLHKMLEDSRAVRISLQDVEVECRSRLEMAITQMAHRRSHEYEYLLEETLLALLWETTLAVDPSLPEATSSNMQYRELDGLPYEAVLWRANTHLLELMGVRDQAI